MDPDLAIGNMTIKSILSNNKDFLSNSIKVTRGDKDYNDYPDPSILAASVWDKNLSEFKMDYLDLDALLNGTDGLQKTEGSELNINEKPHHHHHHHQQHPHHHQQQQHQQQQHQHHQPQQQQQHHHHPHPHVPAQDAPNLVPVVQSPRLMSSQPSSPVDTSSLPELVTDRDNRRLYSVDCKFSPTDLALATPPGQDHYDPASTIFPDEELKPQPIIKKSRKNFVPDNMKDDKYWARRHKNNIAAKRSREARRLKENQIVLRASYLEKENNSLKEDVMRLKAENDMLKNQLKEFQS